MLSRGARRTRAVKFIMVPRPGRFDLLLFLAALPRAATEHQTSVQTQSDVQELDQGPQTCRRGAAHDEGSWPTNGLSERQTLLTASVITTACPSLSPTPRLSALPPPDAWIRRSTPWIHRSVPVPIPTPMLARGTRTDGDWRLNSTDSLHIPLPLILWRAFDWGHPAAKSCPHGHRRASTSVVVPRRQVSTKRMPKGCGER